VSSQKKINSEKTPVNIVIVVSPVSASYISYYENKTKQCQSRKKSSLNRDRETKYYQRKSENIAFECCFFLNHHHRQQRYNVIYLRYHHHRRHDI